MHEANDSDKKFPPGKVSELRRNQMWMFLRLQRRSKKKEQQIKHETRSFLMQNLIC